jgi:hypothetical protein
MELVDKLVKLAKEADDLIEEGVDITSDGLYTADGIDSGRFSSLKWRVEQWEIRMRELMREVERQRVLETARENLTGQDVENLWAPRTNRARLRVVK